MKTGVVILSLILILFSALIAFSDGFAKIFALSGMINRIGAALIFFLAFVLVLYFGNKSEALP